MRIDALFFLAACTSHGGNGGHPPSSTGTPTDGPTTTHVPTTTGDPTVPSVEVACAATENALRFECTVDVSPAQGVELTFARADGLSVARTVSSDDAATEHTVPLYFLAPDQDYDVTARATTSADLTATTSITTGTPPAAVTSALAIDGTSTMGLIGSHFPCSTDAVAVVYDTATGDLVWYQLMDPGGQFGAVDMVQFTDDFTVLGESRGDVIEVDLMGQDLVRLNALDTAFGVTATGLFGNFHHDIMKKNGVYGVFYQETYGGGGFNADVLDTVILFDATGTELARWYPIDHLALPSDWGGDFLHTNAIDIDDAGDFLLSWESQDTVAKIAGDWTKTDFGTPIWILAGSAGGDVGNTITTDWSAAPKPAQFAGQHSLNLRPDGRIQLLDNHDGRGLVLSVDEAAGTATVDGSYPTGSAQCGPQGTSRSTRGGNAIVGCAGDQVREYDGVTGEQVWQAQVQCPIGNHPGSSRWYALDGW